MINPDTILPEEFTPETDIEQLLELCYDKEELVSKVFQYYMLVIQPMLNEDGCLAYAQEAECGNDNEGNFHLSVKFVDTFDDTVWVALNYERSEHGYKPYISCLGASDFEEDEISEHLYPISDTAKDMLKNYYTAFYPDAPKDSTYFIAECSPNNALEAFKKTLGIVEIQMRMDEELYVEEMSEDE